MVPLHLLQKSYYCDRKVQIYPCFCLTQKYCSDVIPCYLWQCVCVKTEVTVNQGEAHCSNPVFNQVTNPKYIMNCPHHKRHQKNNTPDCLVYNSEHPAPTREQYKAKYAPWKRNDFAVGLDPNNIFKVNSSDLIPTKPCCKLPSS